MQIKALLVACVWSFASLCDAREEWGELPDNHYLWGHEGKQSTKMVKRVRPAATVEERSPCVNGPYTRNCWSNGYSIATDFDDKWPTTGKTKSYELTITNGTCNPDGMSPGRICFLINGQYPGPTIEANWGDYISITVNNKLQDNGTSVHWHGIRQFNTNTMDGTNGITQCPLPPGGSETYRFQATQFGTSWYHSHYSAQYGDGIIGPIVINGPASANYDYDLGPVIVNDWFYETGYQANLQWGYALNSRSPGPPGDTILINGKNMSPNGTGSYSLMDGLTPGKKYRLRLINTSMDNSIRVSVDSHPFTVITTDFVPIKPYTSNWVLLAAGQRQDVIITANQAVDSYWMHAQANIPCASGNKGAGSAIVRYSGAAAANPTSTPAAFPQNCLEAFGSPIVPYVSNVVGSEAQFKAQAHALDVNLNLPGTQTNFKNIVTWGINMTALDVQWSTPTLDFVANKTKVYPTTSNVIAVPNEGVWTFWIVQEVVAGPAPLLPHPMHLHGHDFYILGSGTGTFNISSDPDTLTFNNPPRRDTAILPAGGWMVMAFAADNPGAWLMHCHIAFHISEGLGVQFLEAPNKIKLGGSAWKQQCNNWNNYYSGAFYKQDDSGL